MYCSACRSASLISNLIFQIVLSQDPQDGETSSTAARSTTTARSTVIDSLDGLKLTPTTKLVGRRYSRSNYQREEERHLLYSSDVPTKKGHLTILTDASQNTWEKRWFVLRRSAWFEIFSCIAANYQRIYQALSSYVSAFQRNRRNRCY